MSYQNKDLEEKAKFYELKSLKAGIRYIVLKAQKSITQIDPFLIIIVGMFIVPNDTFTFEDVIDIFQTFSSDVFGYDFIASPHYFDFGSKFASKSDEIFWISYRGYSSGRAILGWTK